MASRRHALLTCVRFLSRPQHRGLADAAPKPTSLLASLDTKIELALPGKLKTLWNHPAGLKSIHFWAPCFKWCLVFAGMADYTRPAETLSVRQSGALAATGVIWARYSLVIIPRNVNLFCVNSFLGLTGIMQLIRIYLHTKEQEKLAAIEAAGASQSPAPAVTQA